MAERQADNQKGGKSFSNKAKNSRRRDVERSGNEGNTRNRGTRRRVRPSMKRVEAVEEEKIGHELIRQQPSPETHANTKKRERERCMSKQGADRIGQRGA